MTRAPFSGIALPHMKVERNIIIKNRLGLHARPASRFAQLASTFKSEIRLMRNGESVDGKSILEVLTLACPKGTELIITAEGPDSVEAIEALSNLVENEFGEID